MSGLLKKLVVGFALSTAPAFAGTIENSVGNTVVMRGEGGVTVEYRLAADGTYTQRMPDGRAVSGTWTNDGGEFCATPEGGATSCTRVAPDKNVGDTWNDVDANGSPVVLSIVAGQ